MNIGFLLISCTLVAGEEPAVLDAFHYQDAKTATAEWRPQGIAEVAVSIPRAGGGIELALPFAAKPESGTGDDRPQAASSICRAERNSPSTSSPSDMAAVGDITLYFKSGDGWYGCGSGLRRPGPQTLRFAKTAFRSEGRPGGWEHVDGIRIAVWRGLGENSSLRLSRLAAWQGRAKIAEPALATRVDRSRP